MERYFKPAPSSKTYNIGWQRRQAQINAQKKPNTFSYISPSDRDSLPVQETIEIFDSSIYDYSVKL